MSFALCSSDEKKIYNSYTVKTWNSYLCQSTAPVKSMPNTAQWKKTSPENQWLVVEWARPYKIYTGLQFKYCLNVLEYYPDCCELLQ